MTDELNQEGKPKKNQAWVYVGIVAFIFVVLIAVGVAQSGNHETTDTPAYTIPAPVTPTLQPPVVATLPVAPTRELTLSDAPTILDMSGELPPYFEKVDATSEGMSNKDLGLGSDFSEVQLFLSEDPYQMLYGCFGIMDSRVERAINDAFMRDDSQVRSVIENGLRVGFTEYGMTLDDATIRITHPSIGDLAVLGEGSLSTDGLYVGFDFTMFRTGNVYTILVNMSLSDERQPLIPIAVGVSNRISNFQ